MLNLSNRAAGKQHQRLQTNHLGPIGLGQVAAPPIVHDVIASPGQPLDPSTRSFFEPRFGHDFSQVRVHSGGTAEQSARDVNARAYTVGHNIVFGAGQFSLGTNQGRHLLAHELTHVVQQTGRRTTASGLMPVRASELMLARACNEVKCPTLALPVGAFSPSWQLAEDCLQDRYQDAYGSHTVGRNKNWAGLTGKPGTNEPETLECFRSHYTALGYKPKGKKEVPVERQGAAQPQAEPDIFNFTNKTIMEVTTPNGLGYRTRKLAQEVELATKLSHGCDIVAPNQWSAGTWNPQPCYQVVGAGASLAGKLFFRVWRVGGVLVYMPVLDVTREALAIASATAVIILWRSGAAAAAAAAARGALGKVLAPVMVVATLIALARGAKAGVGGNDDVLSSMFKNAGDKGIEIPDDLKELIQKDPRLKKLLIDAGREGGKMTKAQQEMAAEFTRLVAEHANEFTDEELDQLAAATGEVAQELPDAKLSVEQIKKSLAAAKRGEKPVPGAKGGEGGSMTSTVPSAPTAKSPTKPASAANLPDDLRKRLAANNAATALVEEIAVEQGVGAKMDAAFVEEVLKIVRENKITVQDVEEIAKATLSKTAKGATTGELLAALKAEIASRKPAPGTQPGSQEPSGNPTIPGGESLGDLSGIADISSRVEAEKEAEKRAAAAAAYAKQALKDESKLPAVDDGEFIVLGRFDIPTDLKIKPGDKLPTISLLGRRGGQLYLSVVTPTASKQVTGAAEAWTVTTNPAPMYDAKGNKVGVLAAGTFDLVVTRQKAGARRAGK